MSRIVIIEDSLHCAHLAEKLLRMAGHEAIVATNTQSGIGTVVDVEPDLVLIDLSSPAIDGESVIRQIRYRKSLAHVPIIAYAAWPEATAHTCAEMYGCDGFILKPIDTRAFAYQVETLLRMFQNSDSPITFGPAVNIPIRWIRP